NATRAGAAGGAAVGPCARTGAAWRRAWPELFLPVRAKCVVFAALIGVGEHLVGFIDLLELRLCSLIPRVDVGMVFARELAVRLLYVVRARALLDPQDLVVVFV